MEAEWYHPACVITACSAVNCQPFSAQFAVHIHHSSFNVLHSQLGFPSTVICQPFSAQFAAHIPHLSFNVRHSQLAFPLAVICQPSTPSANGQRPSTIHYPLSIIHYQLFTNYSTTNLPVTDLRSYQTLYK